LQTFAMTKWPCQKEDRLFPINDEQECSVLMLPLLQKLVSMVEAMETEQRNCSKQLEELLHGSRFERQPTFQCERTAHRSASSASVTGNAMGNRISEVNDDAMAMRAKPSLRVNIFHPRHTEMHAVEPIQAHCRTWRTFVTSAAWDYLMVPVVIGNCVTVGLDLNERIRENNGQDHFVAGDTIALVDNGFLMFWILELFVRMLAHGWRSCLSNRWIWFDAGLVILGVVADWVVAPLTSGRTDASFWKSVRLMRVLRALRFVAVFHDAWRMVSGVLFSLSQLASAGCLLFTVIFVFSCLGIECITLNSKVATNDAAMDIVNERFDGVMRAMLTLVSFVTQDSISGFYEPIVDAQPLLCLYFLPIIVIISIAIMNIVLATLLENAMRSVELDKEFARAQKQADFAKLRPAVKKMFQEIDADGDGEITLDEVCHSHFDVPQEYRDKITLPAVIDLFSTIDTDGSGTVGLQEWEQALLCIALNDAPVESTQVLQLLRQQTKNLNKLEKDLQKLLRKMDSVSGTVSGCLTDFRLPDNQRGNSAAVQQTIAADDAQRSCLFSPSRWELSVEHHGTSLGTNLEVSPRHDAMGLPRPEGDLTPLEQN